MSRAIGKEVRAHFRADRAILGGLLAGEPATLFVLPALYSLMVKDRKGEAPRGDPGDD